MKTTKLIALLVLSIMLGSPIWAQNDSDTTKISMGKKKIIIIDDKEKEKEQKESLKQGILEFKQDITVIEDKISKLESEKRATNDEREVKKIEDDIADYEKQIKALEKGINEIEDQIADMEDDSRSRERDRERNRDNKHDHFWEDNWGWDFDFDTRKSKKFNGHWAGFDFGLNNFLNKDFEMKMPEDGQFMELEANSWAFNLNFLEYNIELVDRRSGFVTGMGVEFNNYNFKKNITLNEDNDGVIYGIEDVRSYDKNKLRVSYLTIPLMFEFQSKHANYSKRFFLAAGVVGAVKLSSKTIQKFKEDGDKTKIKKRSDYQINTFKYSAMVRLGYRGLQLFGNYNLVPLFEKDKGPELYPFSVGLTLDF